MSRKETACQTRAWLEAIRSGELDERAPVVQAYSEQPDMANHTAKALSRLTGRGQPLHLPWHALPPLG